MRVRAIKDLTQLDEPDFYIAVAEGLELIVQHVLRLRDGAVTLAKASQHHAARVLTTLAEEEAAKVLILLDAVRCPRLPLDRFSRQLARFNNHLAKGLYARACGMRPVTLADLQAYIDIDRKDFYLDGPNDVDWIFRNQIMQDREGTFYVDYVAHDDGHQWWAPEALADTFPSFLSIPCAVTTALHLSSVGALSTAALVLVARLWRTRVPSPETHCSEIRKLNHLTLKKLDEQELLKKHPDDVYRWIVQEWQFPMYDLDLTPVAVDPRNLRDQQQRWSPDGY